MIRSVDPAHGGTAEAVRQIGSLLISEFGAEVEVLCLDDPKSEFIAGYPMKVHAMGPPKGAMGYTPRFVPWIRAHKDEYDLIVINGLWSFALPGTFWALRGATNPFVVWTHGMLDPYFRKGSKLKWARQEIFWRLYIKSALKKAKAVMFTCEDERVLARQAYGGYHATERVVSLGIADPNVDLDTCRAEFLAAFPELKDKRILLFLSRIDPKKGIDLLIQGAAQFKDEDVMYVIAGPDNAGIQASLASQAQALGVAEKLVWPGMLTGNKKWGAFAACEAFVLPSHQENFGIVVAEAMACGRPVLTTNKVNIWHEVEDSHSGIVANDDAPGIASLLRRWFALTPDEKALIGQNARTCFDEKFEVKRSAKLVFDAYTDILNQRKKS